MRVKLLLVLLPVPPEPSLWCCLCWLFQPLPVLRLRGSALLLWFAWSPALRLMVVRVHRRRLVMRECRSASCRQLPRLLHRAPASSATLTGTLEPVDPRFLFPGICAGCIDWY
jgi:hypothetical protein